MKASNFVSIVMPTFNKGFYIERAIKSVINQKYEDWELIIVDNYSKDNTRSICETYCDHKIKYHLYDNQGIVAKSRNYGIQHANGDWIAFLDSDDWWEDNKLKICSKYFEFNDLIYHDLEIAPNSGLIKKRLKSKSGTSFHNLLQSGNSIPNSSSIIKKILIKKAGGINEGREFMGWEDYDLWLRCLLKSPKVIYVPITLGYYWVGGNISNPDLIKSNLLEIKKRYLSNGMDSEPEWWILGMISATDYVSEAFSYFLSQLCRLSFLSKIKAILILLKKIKSKFV
jgi:glycosyltransferase involved in cell wall biosynthesis